MSNLGDRTTYLGATDIAAIVGVSPYAAPIDVYRQKIGETTGPEQTERMRFGQLLEDAIATGYEERTLRRLFRRDFGIAHRTHPYIIGHPDRLVYEEPGVVELKASMGSAGYGDPGTDQVPPHVRVQVEVYMGLTGREWADVALLRGTRGLDIYTVSHDPELYEGLIDAAVDFWANVQERIPPPIDGTEATRRYLADRFPKDDGLEIVATPEQALLADELRLVKADAKAIESRELLVQNRIKEAMGEHTALVFEGGRITWKQSKDRTTVGWEQVAKAYREIIEAADFAAAVDFDTIEGLYTLTEPGSRRFLATFKAQEEQAAA